MANERELLDKLVTLTKKQIERPEVITPMGTDEAAAEEEQRRLAALRNPPRK